MRRHILKYYFLFLALFCVIPANSSEIDWLSAASAGVKAYKALTLSDEDVISYVKDGVKYMDKENKVMSDSSPYSIRLRKLTAGFKSVDNTPLNFKVYDIKDEINAFACADGSVRIFSSLMDIMTDEELLGVIGHEIGHVANKHTKKAMRQTLLTGALRDALSSAGGTLGLLSDSQLGALGEVMMDARYSQKQEKEADDYGYQFLKKNKKNPWGMVMAFEKLQNMQGKSSAVRYYLNKMFSSHPDMSERISRMKKRCQDDGYSRP